MNRITWLGVAGLLLGLLTAPRSAFAFGPPTELTGDWPQWRGPLMTGEAPQGQPPTEWSETKNVRWKIELPGLGHATPIVLKDRVYILSAVDTGKQAGEGDAAAPIFRYVVSAYDRANGKLVWEQTACESPVNERGHRDGSQASASPVTDGEVLLASFGSQGIYCFDLSGKQLWGRDLGDMNTRGHFGEGSSPALYGDTVVVNWDHEGDSFVVALDRKTGEERWRKARDEPTSWATPIFVSAGDHPQAIINATNFARAYDLKTGDVIWKCSGMTTNVIPTPVADSQNVYLTSGFRGSALVAVRYADAKDDVTNADAVAWKYDGKGTPYIPSPLLYKGLLYFLDANTGKLSCVDAHTGKAHYARERLEDMTGIYASPVAAEDHVYILGRDGIALVLRAGEKLDVLAKNTLDDGFEASPAIAGRELFLRGRKSLYCIAAD